MAGRAAAQPAKRPLGEWLDPRDRRVARPDRQRAVEIDDQEQGRRAATSASRAASISAGVETELSGVGPPAGVTAGRRPPA